ncbi:MAG: hypothetical protein II816_06080 [Elusimicrobia bacterium]|nr:hypothetical protein [Elusimicrobiota bacterium]
MKRKMEGFTMMELIITMIIVIVLSLISWPIYRGHRTKEYTVLGEGYALLGVIKEAQINYYNEWGYFLGPYALVPSGNNAYTSEAWTANMPIFGINAMNNRYFSWFNVFNGAKHENIGRGGMTAFTAAVASKEYGTIIQPFNLTERGEITVLNNAAITM